MPRFAVTPDRRRRAEPDPREDEEPRRAPIQLPHNRDRDAGGRPFYSSGVLAIIALIFVLPKAVPKCRDDPTGILKVPIPASTWFEQLAALNVPVPCETVNLLGDILNPPAKWLARHWTKAFEVSNQIDPDLRRTSTEPAPARSRTLAACLGQEPPLAPPPPAASDPLGSREAPDGRAAAAAAAAAAADHGARVAPFSAEAAGGGGAAAASAVRGAAVQGAASPAASAASEAEAKAREEEEPLRSWRRWKHVGLPQGHGPLRIPNYLKRSAALHFFKITSFPCTLPLSFHAPPQHARAAEKARRARPGRHCLWRCAWYAAYFGVNAHSPRFDFCFLCSKRPFVL